MGSWSANINRWLESGRCTNIIRWLESGRYANLIHSVENRGCAGGFPLHEIPPSRLEQKDECLPLWTLSSLLRPAENIDDIVEKTTRIDAGLDTVKSERSVWNPGFVAWGEVRKPNALSETVAYL